MSSAESLWIRTEQDQDTCVVYVAGEVDLANAADFRTGFPRAQDQLLVIELAELRYIDSAGMRALDDVLRHSKERGCEIRLVAPVGTPARTTLRVAGFDEQSIFDDLQAAKESSPPTASTSPGSR
jgi:anti-anti-sigma factor